VISHELMGGKLHVYKRENSRFWQCATYLAGRNHRITTKQESLAQARDIAEDWYLGLRAKDRLGLIKTEKTFRQAAEQFLKEYEIITEGHRSPKWVASARAVNIISVDPIFKRVHYRTPRRRTGEDPDRRGGRRSQAGAKAGRRDTRRTGRAARDLL